MKKTLALVLALAMVFSTITVAFAEGTLGADAQICADLGMLKGETGTVDAAYVATAPTRLQAAVMFLRLKGLEAEALAFTGEDNFADGNIAWAEGANLLAYLKANPQLGWIGDGTNFNPSAPISAKEYYKVLLETLGYKQTSAEVVGDFTWDNVIEFAATVGLTKVAAVTNYTVNDLAIATVEALKLNVKDTEKTLVATLVEAGKISEAAAVAAGLMGAAPAAFTAVVDDVTAAGNAAVDVVFEDDVDAAAAANVANYSIEGVTINSVDVLGSDAVRLNTSAMTSGKLYTLVSGTQSVQFTAIAKVSGGPEIDTAKGEDVEEVVVTFTKHMDFATGTDIANYSIAGVTIVAAEIDPDDPDQVILTTEGLKNKTKYTVKVTNVKSIDGVAKKSDSFTFTTKYDLTAPKIKVVDENNDVEVQTNQRIVVTFTEPVDQATAEDLANYSIKVDETDGAALEIISVTWDSDDEDNVEIVTEPMEKREDYKLSVVNIADQRKVPNVMTRPATATFKGIAEDESAPEWESITVLSPTTIMVQFKDGSKIDEASALDLNNYDLEDLNIESIKTVKNEWKLFRAILTVEEMETGKNYKLTISDVLDEFGNAMDETDKTAKGISSSFASAKLMSVVATGENAITLTFDKEVDEATAENIANYSIDEEVGAPTKATLQTGDKIVKLEVNDLINGYGEYDLVVDGVEDLAGNSLYFKKKVNTATQWNFDAPELEDADVINNLYTVALSFDEKVALTDAANTWLELYSNITYNADGSVNTKTTSYVQAKDLVDDDTVVEFSGTLTADKDYTVARIVYGDPEATVYDGGVKDLIGNKLLVAGIELGDFAFEASADDPELASVDSYEQTNATTFEVTMSRDVVLTGSSTQNGFTVSVDPDDKYLVEFVKQDGLIKEDADYNFNFASFLKDFHGQAVDNADDTDLTVLTGEYTDTDAPYIEEVVAKNRETIKVVFSEDIPVDGADTAVFTLKNYDLDKEITVTLDTNNDNSHDDGDNVLYLSVGKALEARYEYELTITKGTDTKAVFDFAGLPNEDTESFYFDGTNLAK